MNNIIIKIFRAGTHVASNGKEVTITDNDIQTIVDNYNNQPELNKHEAPIIGGDHNKNGKEALGFVEKLIKNGSELFAQILPSKELVDKVRDNRYKHVSIGLTDGFKFDHLAVLGAVNPAVKGLGLLAFSEDDMKQILEFTFDNKHINNYSQVSIMNPQLQALRDALQKYINDTYGGDTATDVMAKFDEMLKQNGLDQAPQPQQEPAQPQPQGFGQPQVQQRIASQYGTGFSESEDGKKIIAELAKAQEQISRMQFSEFADKNLTKIKPANKDKVIELMLQLDEKETNFSENGKKVLALDLFKSFVTDLPVVIDTTEIAKNKTEFSQGKDEDDLSFIDKIAENVNKRRNK